MTITTDGGGSMLEAQVEAALTALRGGLGRAGAYDQDACAGGLATLAELVEDDRDGAGGGEAGAAAVLAKAGGTAVLGDLLHRPGLPVPMERAACVVLSTIAAHADEATRKQFVSNELIDRFVEILEEHEHFEVLSLAAAALANLSASVPSETAGAIVSAGGVEALVGMLRRMPGTAVLSDASARSGQWAAAALCNLCRQGQDAALAVTRCDGVAAIRACLEDAGDDAGTMHQFLCGALCNLAAIDGEALLFSRSGIGSAVKVLQDGGRKSRARLAAAQVISNLQGDASPRVAAGLKQVEPLLREALTAAALSNGSAAMLREVSSALGALNRDVAPVSCPGSAPSTAAITPRAVPISPEEESAAGLATSHHYGTLGDERPRSPNGVVTSGGRVREHARQLATAANGQKGMSTRRRLEMSREPEPEPEPALKSGPEHAPNDRQLELGSRASVIFEAGPMGVKWSYPIAGGLGPFTLVFVAEGMQASRAGLTEGMQIMELCGQSIDEWHSQGLDNADVIDKMAKTRPLSLVLEVVSQAPSNGDGRPNSQGSPRPQLLRPSPPAATVLRQLQPPPPPPATLVVFEHSPAASSAKHEMCHSDWGVTWVETPDGQGLAVVDIASDGLAALNRMVVGQQLLSVNGRGAYSTRGSQGALKMLRQAKPPIVLKLSLPSEPKAEAELEQPFYFDDAPTSSLATSEHEQGQMNQGQGWEDPFIQSSAELFEMFDADHDGFLNTAECERVARALFPEEDWESEMWEEFCMSYGASSALGLNLSQFAAFRSHATLISSRSVDEIRDEIMRAFAGRYPDDECHRLVEDLLRYNSQPLYSSSPVPFEGNCCA
eukprot:COSAG02_NODE_477_length_21523_cov_11.763163_8_plen_838_part_00